MYKTVTTSYSYENYSINMPIVIINYNSLTLFKNFITQVLKKLPNDIIILDNNSKYEPLLQYYESLQTDYSNKITIHLLNKNYGHTVYITKKKLLPDVYILSDPDLQLNDQMPSNVSDILYNLSIKYKSFKVGLALDLSDSDKFIDNANYFRKKTIKQWEDQFWENPIDDEDYILYKAAVDTTFTIVNCNYFKKKHITGIRIAGIFTCKHLPWYKDTNDKIPEEERNFVRNKNISSTILNVT